MAATRTLAAPAPHAAPPRAVVAALAVSALLAALLVPLPSGAFFLLPSGGDVPPGTRVVGAIPLADVTVVSARLPPPGAVSADTLLSWRSLTDETDPATGTLLDSGVTSTGAPAVWRDTTRGEGAVVALVDTGVTSTADALVGEIDFTGTGGGDGYGHGSFLASLIAGPGGIAPAAGILSLKVAAADGGTDLGTVLTALQTGAKVTGSVSTGAVSTGERVTGRASTGGRARG